MRQIGSRAFFKAFVREELLFICGCSRKRAARLLKRLISLRFGKKLSLDRLDDGLRREIFHTGVGF